MNVMTAAAVDFLVETVGGDICKMGAVFPVTPLPFLPQGYRPRPGSGPATPSEATSHPLVRSSCSPCLKVHSPSHHLPPLLSPQL